LNGPIDTLCNVGPTNGSDYATYTDGSVTFQITREETHFSLSECKVAFGEIVAQCIGKDHVWGGELFAGGVVYDVYENKNRNSSREEISLTDTDASDGILEARAQGGKKKTSPKKTSPKKTSPKKTSPKKTSPKKKTAKAKPPKTPPKGTPKPKRTCAQIIAAVRRRLKAQRAAEKRSDEGSYHRSLRHENLAKRGSKEGVTCNSLTLKSDNYPSSGKIVSYLILRDFSFKSLTIS